MIAAILHRVHACKPLPRARSSTRPYTVRCRCTSSSDQSSAAKVDTASTGVEPKRNAKFNWVFEPKEAVPAKDDGRLIMDLPVAAIRRPLGRTRGNDQEKVEALMESIKEIGLQEPIDVLEVDGVYYGFSGCHRFEAHQRLGAETIRCRVRKATREVLKMHMM